MMEEYFKKIIETVSSYAEKQRGREIRGKVEGRPATEDVEIELDKVCQDIFDKIIKKFRLKVRVYSEHGTYGDASSEYLCAIDPFDGSGLYRRGFDFEWYSVLTFFNLKGVPLAGGCVDILGEKIYLADSKKRKCFLLKNGERARILRKSKKDALNNHTRIAAYMMSPDYLLPWTEKMRELLNKFPGVWIWPNGGAGIYHMISEGKIHAYIMFNEPRSEIDPGLAFAKASGYPVVSVQNNGTCQDYKFLPDTQSERIPFFITASTKQLVRSILKEIT